MCAGCGGKPADVYFVLDTSEDTEAQAVQEQKQFLSDLSALFYLHKGYTRVGVVSYGFTAITTTPLGASVTLPEVQAAVQDAPRVGGSRHTSQVGQSDLATDCSDYEYSGIIVRVYRLLPSVMLFLVEDTLLFAMKVWFMQDCLIDQSPASLSLCLLDS